jgi:hypothetical protein
MQVWQVAAGDVGRDYSEICLKHDVMIVGPGNFGAYGTEEYDLAVERGDIDNLWPGTFRSFAEGMEQGDIVLLRRGHRVVAIGVIDHGGYGWNETFDDVYGWDLQHTRRVVWQEHLSTALRKIQQRADLFGHRRQIPTFTRVNEARILRRIQPLIGRCQQRHLRPLPRALPQPLTLEELGEAMFNQGLPYSAVSNLVGAIERQRKMLRFYREHGEESDRPGEHEIVAYMVLPLLQALGWSEQLLAVEWHKVDLAVFNTTPTTADSCRLVCETKHMGHGLQDILEQATGYCESLELKKCRKILLTQGGRFYLYERVAGSGKGVDFRPTGYVNLERIRTDHIAPSGTNAVETLMNLTPMRM